MRIDLQYSAPPVPQSDRSISSCHAEPGNASAARAQSAPDHAQISGTHIEVQALTAQACQRPEVPDQKLQELRQAILGSRYKPEPGKIAQALVAHMLSSPEL